jgi:hypothetical protein
LLLYAKQVDAMSSEAQRQVETIERNAAALAELRAWREAMERSHTFRLMRRLDGLYRLQLIGPALRALRRALPRRLS